MKVKSDSLVLGIDLGGTEMQSAVIDSHGSILSRCRRAAPAGKDQEGLTRTIVESTGQCLNRASIKFNRVDGIGIAASLTGNSNGAAVSSDDLPGWNPADLKRVIEEALSVEAFLIDNASAAACGEYRFGAARGFRHILYVALNADIAGGIVIDGKLYTGAGGLAGEFGHMMVNDTGPCCNCGNSGCWQALASETAMVRAAKEKIAEGVPTKIVGSVSGDLEKIAAGVIQTAAEEGDLLARELISKTGYYLGIGFANLIHLFNPEIVVTGGSLSDMGDALLAPAYKTAAEKANKIAYDGVRFAPAALGKDSGVLGAAAFALEKINATGAVP